MVFFRSLLLIVSWIVFIIGSLILNFLIFPIAKLMLKESEYYIFSSRLIQVTWSFLIKFMEFLRIIKTDIKNPEVIKNIKNKIIVATHPSFLDVVILISIIPKTTCFVKNSLTKNFAIKNIVNSIFIPNDIEIEELKTEAKKLLDNGFNLIIFPTGTRHREDEHPKVKKGVSLIALTSEKNIVPVKIKMSEEILFINQPCYYAGKKTVIYETEAGEEINTAAFKDENEIIAKRNLTKEIENQLYK